MSGIQFGLVIVGDEILLGKRQDSHFAFVRKALEKRGLHLSWVRIVGDDHALLVETYRQARASGAVIFSCGGIGATPDDLTRQAAAAAYGCPLEPHPEGLAMLRAKFGAQMNARRQRLIEFPKGAALIPNPVNQVPGFSLGSASASGVADKRPQAGFVPGFPQMAEPMIEWLLDTYYADAFKEKGDVEALIRVLGVPESDLIPLIEAANTAYPAVKIACLPDTRRDGVVELGIRGVEEVVLAAASQLERWLGEQDMRHTRLDAGLSGHKR